MTFRDVLLAFVLGACAAEAVVLVVVWMGLTESNRATAEIFAVVHERLLVLEAEQ